MATPATLGSAPATKVEPQPAPPPPASASASSSSSSSPNPKATLDVEHYVPRLPLQLVAIAFALVAPPLSRSRSSPSSSSSSAIPRPADVLAAYIHDPVPTLSVATALVAVVQLWFGYGARSGTQRDAARTSTAAAAAAQRSAARRTTAPKGFRAVFSQIWKDPVGSLSSDDSPFARGRRQGAGAAGGGGGGIDFASIAETALVTFLATAAIHTSAVLLGAPFIADAGVTLLLSLLVALLAVTPLAIAVPPFQSTANGYVWLRLVSTLSPANDLELALFAPAVGTVIGCWTGAVPIPLDWDRPWQKYPTTLILGAVAGHAAGSLVSLATVSYRAVVRAAARALLDDDSSSSEHHHNDAKKKNKKRSPGAAVAAALKARAKASAAAANKLGKSTFADKHK
ncbi:hypothetical protein JCM3774_002956 [Rhodotorula dairenensis]